MERNNEMSFFEAKNANDAPKHNDAVVEQFFSNLPKSIHGNRLAILELAEKSMPEHLDLLIDEFIAIEDDLRLVSQRQPTVMREALLVRGIDLDIRDDSDRIVRFVASKRRHRPMR